MFETIIFLAIVLGGLASFASKAKANKEAQARKNQEGNNPTTTIRPQPVKRSSTALTDKMNSANRNSSSREDMFKLYRSTYSNPGKNGDSGPGPKNGEIAYICGYCGAKNIIPAKRTVAFTCYFCRERL